MARAHTGTLGWNLRGRRSWRGAEWQKLDIQKVSRKVNLISVRRAIIGQQFFSSRISFSFPPPLPRFSSVPSPRLRCRGAARPEVAQTRQGSYLLEERVLRVTAGCSLFLDYCYAGGWRTGRREEDGEGGRRRKNGRVCVCGGREKKKERAKETRWMEVERERASQWKHRESCLPLSKIVIVSLGLSLDALDPEDYP